jgi:tRNA(fMet)-specific endonuclease VapC
VLDTNIVIALFANEAGITDQLATMDEVFIPSIVIGELFYGAMKSSRAAENLRRVDHFVSISSVLGCDAQTGLRYAQIKNEARARGRPLPENDLWIAAIALQHDLPLVTRDMHFDGIEALATTAW